MLLRLNEERLQRKMVTGKGLRELPENYILIMT